MNKQIVVYNNSTGIVEIMEPLFAGEKIGMLVAGSYGELVKILESKSVHLMLVDVELQESGMGEGIELISNLRKSSSVPIIVVSSQSAETAKITALNVGADDYVTSGCNPLELLARVKSHIRRYTELVNMCATIDSIYRVDGLELNDVLRTVYVDGREVKLTPIEYKILRLLVQQKGKVFPVSQIYEAIWNMQAIGADNTIAVHIRHIREKIESIPRNPDT